MREWRAPISVVVGTFSAVPYVHMQLEARARFYPEVPMLVHDDGSPSSGELVALCHRYGVDFVGAKQRQMHTLGDLQAMFRGLCWSNRTGAQILVKMSRRFVPLADWTGGLSRLWLLTRRRTFSNECKSFGFGFRTECLALDVRAWTDPDVLTELGLTAGGSRPVFVEGFVHELARRVAKSEESSLDDGRSLSDFGEWDYLGKDRCRPQPGFLWHDSHSPADYAAKAREWGLRYADHEFEDPNGGAGNGVIDDGHGGYIRVLATIAEYLPRRSCYLELGVASGASFSRVAPLFECAVGVDCVDIPQHLPGIHVESSTDEFFKSTALCDVDLVFIDACHEKRQVLRDVKNALRVIRPGTGIIVIHDTYPPDEGYQSPELCWDAWRAAEVLRRSARRMGVELMTLPLGCGLTLLRSCCNENRPWR